MIIKIKNYSKTKGNTTFKAEVRIEHLQGNKLPYFAITGEILVNGRIESCGCLHEMIEKEFPVLKKYIPFHLCDNDGTPMYYFENSEYHFKNKNIKGSKECSLYGILDEDEDFNLSKATNETVHEFLKNRLSKVQKEYIHAMQRLFD